MEVITVLREWIVSSSSHETLYTESKTHAEPTVNIKIRPAFFALDICKEITIGMGIKMIRKSVITPKMAVDWNNADRLIQLASVIVISQPALIGLQAKMALKKMPVFEPTSVKMAAQVAHLNQICWF